MNWLNHQLSFIYFPKNSVISSPLSFWLIDNHASLCNTICSYDVFIQNHAVYLQIHDCVTAFEVWFSVMRINSAGTVQKLYIAEMIPETWLILKHLIYKSIDEGFWEWGTCQNARNQTTDMKKMSIRKRQDMFLRSYQINR